MKYLARLSFVCIFFFLSNCFEYEETIYFQKGLSGFVEIQYQIPLKEDKKTSLIRHLPAGETEIQDLLSNSLRKGNQTIQDYKFTLLEKGEFSEPFFDYKALVSYKIEFSDIADIERMLPGNMIAKSKGKTITIRREFPSFSQEFMENLSIGEKKIISEISKLLKDGFMKFRVVFPGSTECISNRGFVSIGNLSYSYFLSDSLEENQGKVWEYRLRFY